MRNKLLLKLEHRNSKVFFTFVEKDQLEVLEETGQMTQIFEGYCHNFCKSCVEYIQELCVPFLAPLQYVDCISLEKVHDWKYV